MKKLLVALPFVAGASWAGTTLYAGNQSHTTYDEVIAQLNEFKPFAVENESYDAGFLKSVAVTRVKDSSAADARVLFRLRHEIDHSSVAFDSAGARIGSSIIKTTLLTDDFPTEIKNEFLSGFTDSTPFVLTTSMGVGGSKSNHLIVNTYTKTVSDDSGQELLITFDGGNYQISHENENVTVNGSLGEFMLSARDMGGMSAMEMTIAPSSTVASMQRVSTGIYTGEISHTVPAIDTRFHDVGMNVSLRKVNMASSTSLQNDSVSTDTSFSVGNLEAPIPLTSAGFSMAVSGIPLEGLQTYMNLMNDIPLMQQLLLEDPEAARQYIDVSKALIAPGSAISYQLNASNDGGDMMAAVKMEFVGDGSASGYDSVETMGDALRTVRAKVSVDGDAAAVDMTPLGMIMMMSPEAEQFIVADGTSYKAELSVENLNADLNGVPFALDMMMGEMLDMPIDMLMGM